MDGDTTIGLLGPLEARRQGAVVPVNGPRLQTLVALLALAAGREMPRDELIEALWHDEAPRAPDNALQALVSRLRRAAPALVAARPTGYRLLVARDRVDALRFESLVRDARREQAPQRRAGLLRDALALWRGAPLAGLTSVPALHAQAARLTELRRGAVEERIAAELAAGSGAELVPELEGLVAEFPLRETLQLQLLQALRAAGRTADALTAYERARVLLADELGVDPSPALRSQYHRLLRENDVASPAPAAAPPPAGSRLPVSLTPLLGRDADVSRVRGLLDGARLVTVTGPGGIGKTRVALQVAADAGPVWLTELAAVADPADVPRAMLGALGAGDGGLFFMAGAEADPVRRLAAVLADRDDLLLIDNCEHLVDAVTAVVSRLLAACPRLRVLITSRQPLGIPGEHLHPLEGLPLPADPGWPAVSASPAVRLFADRGRAAQPSFRLDAGTAAAVTTICRSLDGVPLALELAAARLRSLSAAEIVARLHDRFALLQTGNRGADARRRGLRAVIDWSWELLDPAEQALARRFAVFAGPVGGSHVARVCFGPEDDPWPAAGADEILARLVDKSMVQTGTRRDETVYRMLDSIRLYALERLRAAGEETALRRRHAEAMLRVAESTEPRLRTRDQLAALEVGAAHVDEFHAALHFAVGAEPELAVRLVAALQWFWLLSGRRTAGGEWTERVLGLEAPGAPGARALICAIGALHHGALLGDEQGAAYLAEARRLTATLTDRHPVLELLGVLEPLARGDTDDVTARLGRQAGAGEPWLAAQSAMHLGRVLLAAGRPEPAAAALESAETGFRRLGERFGLGQTLGALAELSGRRGEHERAVAALSEALTLVGELGAVEDRAMMLVRRGAERSRQGDTGGARDDLRTALEEAARLGLAETAGAAQHGLADVSRWFGGGDAVRELLDHALAQVRAGGRGVGHQPAIVTSQAYLAVAEGRIEDAAGLCRRLFELARQAGDAQVSSRVAVLAAAIAIARDRLDEAADLVQAAGAVRGHPIGADPDEVRIRDLVRRHVAAGGPRPIAAGEMEALLLPVIRA